MPQRARSELPYIRRYNGNVWGRITDNLSRRPWSPACGTGNARSGQFQDRPAEPELCTNNLFLGQWRCPVRSGEHLWKHCNAGYLPVMFSCVKCGSRIFFHCKEPMLFKKEDLCLGVFLYRLNYIFLKLFRAWRCKGHQGYLGLFKGGMVTMGIFVPLTVRFGVAIRLWYIWIKAENRAYILHFAFWKDIFGIIGEYVNKPVKYIWIATNWVEDSCTPSWGHLTADWSVYADHWALWPLLVCRPHPGLSASGGHFDRSIGCCSMSVFLNSFPAAK